MRPSARRDERAFVEEMALKAEEAARRNDQGELYKITNTVCGEFHNDSNAPVADKLGRLITSKAKQDKDGQDTFRKSSISQSQHLLLK